MLLWDIESLIEFKVFTDIGIVVIVIVVIVVVIITVVIVKAISLGLQDEWSQIRLG